MEKEDNLTLYRDIRDETEKFVQDLLNDLPDNFTMMHLECLKIIVPQQVDDRLLRLKMGTRLRYYKSGIKNGL